tara:strand:+ start:496 stop:615 length:120 start_codon:yes stop_codon:yes gene_type:complete
LTKAEGTTQEEKWLREALMELDSYKSVTVNQLEAIEYEE